METVRKMLKKPEWLIGFLFALAFLALAKNAGSVNSTDGIWSPLVVNRDSNLIKKGYDIVYVIDDSASMLYQDPEGTGKKAFEKITSLALDYDVRIGVVFFAENAGPILDLTYIDSPEKAQEVTNFITTFREKSNVGSTNIASGLKKANEMLLYDEIDREKRIILFSDGMNSSDFKDSMNTYETELHFVLDDLETKNVVLYGILCRNSNSYQDITILKNTNVVPSHFIDISDVNTEEYLSTIVNQFFEVLVDKADRISLNAFLPVDVNLDRDNSGNFYVPECGITRMEIFFEDINPISIEINPLGCSNSFVSLSEKTALYSYENPTSGFWSINYKDGDINKIEKCTVSIVTNLGSRVELTQKGDLYYASFHFYDNQGNEIFIDDTMSLSAQIHNEGGGIVPIPNVDKSLGVLQSDVFSIPKEFEENGTVDFRLTYSRYLQKNYSVIMPVRNYSVNEIENKRYYGKRTSEGIEISIPLENICNSDGINTIKLSEKCNANMVTALLQDNYVTIIVQEKGAFQGDLFLGDSTGIESTVSVRGTAVTTKSIIVTFVVVVASLLILVGTVLNLQRKTKTDTDP